MAFSDPSTDAASWVAPHRVRSAESENGKFLGFVTRSATPDPMTTFSRCATIDWHGDVRHGSGLVIAGTEAFSVPVTFPRLNGEPSHTTTPEELLAASHATCFGIGLRSVIGQRGGTARRILVTATITADKGARGIRIVSSHLHGQVAGLSGIDSAALPGIARAAEEGCTISAVIRASAAITVEVSEAQPSTEGNVTATRSVQADTRKRP